MEGLTCSASWIVTEAIIFCILESREVESSLPPHLSTEELGREHLWIKGCLSGCPAIAHQCRVRSTDVRSSLAFSLALAGGDSVGSGWMAMTVSPSKVNYLPGGLYEAIHLLPWQSLCPHCSSGKKSFFIIRPFLLPRDPWVAHQAGLMACCQVLPAREASGLLKLKGQLAGSVHLEGLLQATHILRLQEKTSVL